MAQFKLLNGYQLKQNVAKRTVDKVNKPDQKKNTAQASALNYCRTNT